MNNIREILTAFTVLEMIRFFTMSYVSVVVIGYLIIFINWMVIDSIAGVVIPIAPTPAILHAKGERTNDYFGE